jgi:hypothetical protein
MNANPGTREGGAVPVAVLRAANDLDVPPASRRQPAAGASSSAMRASAHHYGGVVAIGV